MVYSYPRYNTNGAMAGVVGELAEAVGYQQGILWCNPVGL
jgi:hypothetical protein